MPLQKYIPKYKKQKKNNFTESLTYLHIVESDFMASREKKHHKQHEAVN